MRRRRGGICRTHSFCCLCVQPGQWIFELLRDTAKLTVENYAVWTEAAEAVRGALRAHDPPANLERSCGWGQISNELLTRSRGRKAVSLDAIGKMFAKLFQGAGQSPSVRFPGARVFCGRVSKRASLISETLLPADQLLPCCGARHGQQQSVRVYVFVCVFDARSC